MATVERVAAAAKHRTDAQALFNAESTANYIAMSQEWVRKAAREGRLPSVKVGTSLRFRKTALDEWIAQHERVAS